jgi:hypothetical protein
MGIIKNRRKLRKAMRDVGQLVDHHGSGPSIREVYTDIGAMADDRGEREVLKDGVPARAVAKGMPESVPGDRWGWQILLTVHPASGSPYDVNHVFALARQKAAVSIGMEIPVKVHPDDPQRIAIQWEAHQASLAAAGGEHAAVYEALKAAYAGTADAAMREAMAAGSSVPAPTSPSPLAADDPVAKLTKLVQMRDAGLITTEEFDEKKARLLRDF